MRSVALSGATPLKPPNAGEESSYDGRVFPISTSLELNDPALRRVVRSFSYESAPALIGANLNGDWFNSAEKLEFIAGDEESMSCNPGPEKNPDVLGGELVA
jgi:hypothetical protein